MEKRDCTGAVESPDTSEDLACEEVYDVEQPLAPLSQAGFDDVECTMHCVWAEVR